MTRETRSFIWSAVVFSLVIITGFIILVSSSKGQDCDRHGRTAHQRLEPIDAKTLVVDDIQPQNFDFVSFVNLGTARENPKIPNELERVYGWRKPDQDWNVVFDILRDCESKGVHKHMLHNPFGRSVGRPLIDPMDFDAAINHDLFLQRFHPNANHSSQDFGAHLRRFLTEYPDSFVWVYLGSMQTPKLKATKKHNLGKWIQRVGKSIEPFVDVARDTGRVGLIFDQMVQNENNRYPGLDSKIKQDSPEFRFFQLVGSQMPVAVEPHAFWNLQFFHFHQYRQVAVVKHWLSASAKKEGTTKFEHGVTVIAESANNKRLVEQAIGVGQRNKAVDEVAIHFKLIDYAHIYFQETFSC